jgi:hypothetical protein
VVVNRDVPNFGEADWLVTNFGRIWKVALLDINSFLSSAAVLT